MATVLTDRKKVGWTIFLFMMTYMVSYITRINYGAVILEMVKSTGETKSALSMAVTGSFITYGAGQIVSGICGDKFRPKLLVFFGLILSAAMNIAIPFCPTPVAMLGVWCVNGFAQAFMWPPIVRLMSTLFSSDDYKKATVLVSWGSSFGTIFVYLVAPLFVSYLNWKFVFWCSASLGVIMAIVWILLCPDIPPEKKAAVPEEKTDAPKKSAVALLVTPLMIFTMLAVVLQGALRDGVTTWMPTYVAETFDLSSSISILTGVVLPIFSILSFQLASTLYRKKLTNPLTCACVFFAVGAVSALLLCFFSDVHFVLSVILSALLTGCMHGVNLLLVCMVPEYFKKYGNVSTVSGVLNSCTYIGSAISTYGIALLAENSGWKITLLVWFFIAFAGAAVCFVFAPVWKKKNMR